MIDNDAIILQAAYVLGHFGVPGPLHKMCKLDNGHINHTYVAHTDQGRYIVQRINNYVFTRPQDIMENIDGVTAHILSKLSAEGRDTERGTLHYFHDAEGLNYYTDGKGSFWRVCPYIEHTRTYEQVPHADMLESAGYAFGEFQRMLSDYPMETLHETIVDFHNTKKRMDAFFRVVEEDGQGRCAALSREIDFFQQRRESAGRFTDLIADGTLPLRVTHNDTKYNNILIDDRNGKPVCVIDLDTVMPGLSVYDFGDAIRFAANTALEDEVNLAKVSLNMEYFEAFTKGFMEASRGAFTPAEVDLMAQGCINITLELASRFLADHIQGDKYFAVHHPNHNLERARNQMALAADMEKHLPEMNRIVRRYA